VGKSPERVVDGGELGQKGKIGDGAVRSERDSGPVVNFGSEGYSGPRWSSWTWWRGRRAVGGGYRRRALRGQRGGW
jgi:hypothetical protein